MFDIYNIKSVSQLFSHFGFKTDRREYWRLTKVESGQINGLAGHSGYRVAASGVLCAIITADERLVLGHNDWFVPTKHEKEEVSDELKPTKKSRSIKLESLIGLLESLQV